MSSVVAPLLVLGWGNPSRGDDALGPLLVERIDSLDQPPWPPGQVECLTDFQLQVEHALDLVGRQRVLFVDAAIGLPQPCTLRPLHPSRHASLSTHALAPEAVLQVFTDLHGRAPPPCTMLAIRATAFELGQPLSAQAQADLELALACAIQWLSDSATAVHAVVDGACTAHETTVGTRPIPSKIAG